MSALKGSSTRLIDPEIAGQENDILNLSKSHAIQGCISLLHMADQF